MPFSNVSVSSLRSASESLTVTVTSAVPLAGTVTTLFAQFVVHVVCAVMSREVCVAK